MFGANAESSVHYLCKVENKGECNPGFELPCLVMGLEFQIVITHITYFSEKSNHITVTP